MVVTKARESVREGVAGKAQGRALAQSSDESIHCVASVDKGDAGSGRHQVGAPDQAVRQLECRGGCSRNRVVN